MGGVRAYVTHVVVSEYSREKVAWFCLINEIVSK